MADSAIPSAKTAARSLKGSRWSETAVVVSAAALVLLAMTLPAFRAGFFAENFVYLGLYQTHGANFWRALLSPTNNIFFRPVFFTVDLPWFWLLPLEPVAYHVRNFVFSLLAVTLLHRVLVRLVKSQDVRVIALLFFTVSKIHLTMIGYINLNDTIVSLILVLATILAFLRYVDYCRPSDYILALLLCFFCTFTKDYGIVIVFVVLTLVVAAQQQHGWAWIGRWSIKLSPLVFFAAFAVWMHQHIVGPLPSGDYSDPTYVPRLDTGVTIVKLIIFASTLANVTPFPSGIFGASGIGFPFLLHWTKLISWIEHVVQGHIHGISWGDAFLGAGFLLLLGVTAWKARPIGKIVLVPLVWMAAYCGPTLLTRNEQMYYFYEATAAVAVLVGLLLDRSSRTLRRIWWACIVLIALNGVISNYRSYYGWQFVSDKARDGIQPVINAAQHHSLTSVSFITSNRSFWGFALGSPSYPLLPTLCRQPNLQVRWLTYEKARDELHRSSPSRLILDIDNGFLRYPEDMPPPLSITQITPPWTPAGMGFSRKKAGGYSVLKITGEHFTPATIAVVDGRRLRTQIVNPKAITALIPDNLLRKPAELSLYLTNGISKSNVIKFTVADRADFSESFAPPGAGKFTPLPSPTIAPPGVAQLKAEPNPVVTDEQLGVTKISWNTGTGALGQLFVSCNGAEEQLVAEAASGSTVIRWIATGSVYKFLLYEGTDQTQLVGSLTVTAMPSN